MNGRISSIAAGPHSNDHIRRARVNGTLKPGFLIRKEAGQKQLIIASSHLADPIAASTSDEAPMSDQLEAKQGAAAKDADDPSQTTEKVEELPKPVPGFEAAQAPKLIAVDTTSISLQWQSVAQLPADEAAQAYSRSLGDDVVLPNCDVEYCLQTRQMGPRESKADLSIPNVTWQNCYRGKDTFTQVRNLRPGRRYAYRIVIKPDVVPPWADPPEQPPSAAEIYETPATVPMPPKPIKCTRRERAAFELRWFEPGETGGRPIQEYTAQMRPPPADAAGQHPNLEGFVEIYRGRENRHRQKNLAHATEYEFRLKARNEVGESAWSDVVAYMTKATVPGDPQAPALISAGATALQLHWPQPSDGGSAITHYVLQWDNGDGGPLEHELKTPMPLAEVNDLRSSRTYRFRVQAFNEVGHSQPSTITELRTGCTVPACPGPPRVTGATKSTVTLAWKAPEETGGSQVLDYEAEVQPKSRAAMDGGMADEWMLVYQGDRAMCTIQCLRAGCTYRVRARARNASGYSSYSGASDAQTAPDRPLAPEPPVAAARSASSISVTWVPPQHDGGSAISAYRLELCRDAPQIAVSAAKLAQLQYEMVPLENSGVDCRADIPDLEPGLDYLLRVSAVNAQGPSPASEPACISTKASPPVAPEPPYVAVPAAANSLQLEWPEPWGCGAPVSGYAVEMAPADAVLTVQGPPTPPQEGAGDALASSLTAIAEPLQQLAPSIASSMDAEDSASMCASAAGEPGSAGAPEQHRPQPARARRRAGSKRKGPWVSVYSGPERSCRADGLDPFTEYGFKVRATNAAGHSDWSSMSCLRTASGPPTAPSNLHADGSSSTSILTCWDMPTNDYGSAITAYHVEVSIAPPRQKSAPSWQRAYSGIATTCEVEGLRPGKSYLFRVRASNAKGQGPWSSTSGAETQPAPPEPPGAPVISQRASTSARCKWDVPVEDHGAAVLRYRLEVSEEGREWQEAWRGLGTSARIGGLRPGRAHQARVVASNAVGEGAFSRTAAFTTLLLAPPAPAQLQAEPLEEPLSLVVGWVLPEADDSHAEAACHEIEAISLPDVGLGHSSRGKASGRAQQHELADVQPGLTYEVKVRSVGASGAGHSPWSEPVAVTMPGRAEAPPPAPASTASEASEAPKRRRKKGGHERELEQADPKRKVAQKKVARKPKEHTFFLLRFWRAHRMKCVLGLVVTAMLLLFVSGISMGNIEKSARQMAKEMEAERREASAEQAKRRAEENERIQRNRQFKAQGQARLEELIRDAKLGKKIKQGGKERRFGSDPFDFVPPGVTPQDFMFGDGPLLGPTRG